MFCLVTCCSTVTVSTGNSDIASAFGSYLFGKSLVRRFRRYLLFEGTYTYTAGDEINNRPIYRLTGGTAYFAVKTVTSPSLPNWIGSNTAAGSEPGSGAGFIFEKDYLNPKCPHAVSNWEVYYGGQTVHDTEFKVQCAVGESVLTLS